MWSAEAQVKNVLFLFLDKKKVEVKAQLTRKETKPKQLPSAWLPDDPNPKTFLLITS
jgi:hypothetical protein